MVVQSSRIPPLCWRNPSALDHSYCVVATGIGIFEFVPILQVAHDDADTDIIWLDAQGAGYQAPVDDLWLSTHKEWHVALTSNEFHEPKTHL